MLNSTMSMIAIGLNKNFLPLLRNTSWSFVFYIAVAALVVRVTYAFIEWQKQCQSVSHLPGYSFGFMGQIPSIVKNFDHLYDWESSNFNKYGPTFKMTGPFWSIPQIWTKDSRNIEHVLKTNFRNYVKPEKLRTHLKCLVGDGIFRLNHGFDDPEYILWHSQRKIMSKIFFKKNYEDFLSKVFIHHSEKMCGILKHHAANQTAVDIMQLMYAFTLDSIAQIGVGLSFNTLNSSIPNDNIGNIHCNTKVKNSKTMSKNIGKTFDKAQAGIWKRIKSPFYHVPILGKLIYKSERNYARLIKELDDFCQIIISERRSMLSGNSSSKRKKISANVGEDYLSLFMSSDAAKTMNFTDKQLRDIVLSMILAGLWMSPSFNFSLALWFCTFIISDTVTVFCCIQFYLGMAFMCHFIGRDTTACTLSFAVAELMQNQDILKKLRMEINDKLGHTDFCGGNQVFDIKDLSSKNLPYLHGFIYEMLRIHPPVPTEAKQSVHADIWPDGTRVPAQTTIRFSAYAMGRDSKRWPDPLKVKPERWHNNTPSAFEFPVFQAGPRSCLGDRMALLEIKINLARLMHGFDFSPAKTCKLPPKYNVGLTQSIKGGLPIIVENLN